MIQRPEDKACTKQFMAEMSQSASELYDWDITHEERWYRLLDHQLGGDAAEDIVMRWAQPGRWDR